MEEKMQRRFIIEKFGKIERAEIQVSPLTLFVGDNNSGKSYLLSLLWAIYSAEDTSAIFHNFAQLQIKKKQEVYDQLCKFVLEADKNPEQEIELSSQIFVDILNEILEENKDRFVASIFNSDQVTIKKLAVEVDQEFSVKIVSQREERGIKFYFVQKDFAITFSDGVRKDNYQLVTNVLILNLLLWFLKGENEAYSFNTVYLPAARTGFVLAKNVINRVGRQIAYDISEYYDKSRRMQIQPFTKPVIRFLDMLEELSAENKTQYAEIVNWMEQSMTHGKVQYGGEAGAKEIRYVPEGSPDSLPLRTSSAVVTEVTPLLMLLKYGYKLKTICYEEPEMCLHPRLQQEMGKLLIRLVNSGVTMITTTHSDIIIQHINNMCQLKEIGAPKELMDRLELSNKDVIDLQNVAVYQFTDQGAYSVIERVMPENGQFQIHTFSDALLEILQQTSEVQDYEPEQEG